LTARTALLAAVLLLGPVPAFAHAILVDSVPAPQSHVPAGRLAISLRYNSRIDAERSKVTLTGPDGTTERLEIASPGRPDMLRAEAMLRPGEYVLRWQVLAVDGHITRGDVPFTVTEP
jgi:methionine-rich copper-binding protein CopC